MDWFEKITGFRETTYEETRAKLKVQGSQLRSLVTGACYEVGVLELVSLQELRRRAGDLAKRQGSLKVSIVAGDVRQMHHSAANAGALFQVASQFNLLEMVSPNVTPEDGVTRYQGDHTQGPACAIAAGAATIYRNYFADVEGKSGQTKVRQIDGLGALGRAFSTALDVPLSELWRMQNGYVMANPQGLKRVGEYVKGLAIAEIDGLREKLCIGLHWDVDVTDAPGPQKPKVSQAFCSALPVAYNSMPASAWETFARLVLEAAYEATILAALANARRGASNVVYLTLLGGGAFGNNDAWIYDALERSLRIVAGTDLDVRLVSYSKPSNAMLSMVGRFN